MSGIPVLQPIVSLGEALAADQDTTTFSLSHPKHIPLFTSPLKSPNGSPHGEHLLKQPSPHYASSGESTPPHVPNHDTDEPVLKQTHESNTIQLFYDLFFVANLTTFTSIHEINSAEALKSYVGFFSILWFTWLQVALFDARFSNDSAFERLCKAIQFGIMVGFAVVGPTYSTEYESNGNGTISVTEIQDNSAHLQAFATLSLILMISRIVLALQYCVALMWTHKYKKAILPLVIHIATLWISAFAFLGLYFSFRGNAILFNTHGIIGWYVVIGVEAFIILLVSGRWKFLSFRRTCLVERLGLLTLIILGEGIIGLCNSIRKVETDSYFPANVIGQIICSVLIIYFIWMLYFDQIETERVGTLRQQIWTMLHFPFHVCVLLVVEGISQIAVWTKLNDDWIPGYTAIFEGLFNVSAPLVNGLYVPLTNPNLTAVQLDYYSIENIFPNNTLTGIELPDITSNIESLLTLNTTDPNYTDAGYNIIFDLLNYVFENFGIEAPKGTSEGQADQAAAVIGIFQTVYLYLFICAGFLLLFLAALFWLGKRRKTRGEFLSIALRIIIGIGISLLSILYAPALRNNSLDAFDTYFFSSWMLPTIVFAYLFVIVGDTLLVNFVRTVVYRRHARGANNV